MCEHQVSLRQASGKSQVSVRKVSGKIKVISSSVYVILKGGSLFAFSERIKLCSIYIYIYI